jgi:hypothetical protein
MSRFYVSSTRHDGGRTSLYAFDREKEKYLTSKELQAELDALDSFREKVALEAQVNAAPPKLTIAQKRVLKALIHGWKAVPSGTESFLYINGKRACKIENMLALKDMGLVELEIDGDDWVWKISEGGRLIGGKL